MDTIKINKGTSGVKIVAHRGLSGIEPENTLLSFVAAGNRSYYGIETDVHYTSDGKYVCMHDSLFKRTAGIDERNVEEMTYDEARSIPLFDKTGKISPILHIPSLAEYIETCKRYGKISVLELKSSFTKKMIGEIIDIISQIGYLENVIFISFNYQNLVYVKELKPEQNVQYLVSEIKDGLPDMLKAHNMNLDIYYKPMLDKKNVDSFKNNGIEINVWTCDSADEARTLIENGVDYITSNIIE